MSDQIVQWVISPCATNTDKAGQRGLADLVGKSAQIHSIPIPVLGPGDKDITDYPLAGGDLWEWLKYHLDRLGVLPALDVRE